MTKSDKIESLLNAIAYVNGAFHDPESVAYKLRNPLLVKSFAVPGKHEVDAEGRRVFDTFEAGYRAGRFDLELKLSGASRANIKLSDTLDNVMRVYSITQPAQQREVLTFLRKALNDSNLRATAPVSFFTSPDRPKTVV